MPYTKEDVGERPGRPLLEDDEKQAIADRWNANEAEQAAEVAAPTLADKVEALLDANPGARAAAEAKARQ